MSEQQWFFEYTWGRGQRAEGRGQRGVGRGQRAEGSGQRAGGRGEWAVGSGRVRGNAMKNYDFASVQEEMLFKRILHYNEGRLDRAYADAIHQLDCCVRYQKKQAQELKEIKLAQLEVQL